MLLHVDGARLANAAASLGAGLGEITTEAGVDAVSFGATKNGGLVGDVDRLPAAGDGARLRVDRKQGMQLASKTRFLSAQLEAMLGAGELWRRTAEPRQRDGREAGGGGGGDRRRLELAWPVQANGVFATLPREAIDGLMEELPGSHPFYVWDEDRDVVRWLCSWDTTEEDVDGLLEAVR